MSKTTSEDDSIIAKNLLENRICNNCRYYGQFSSCKNIGDSSFTDIENIDTCLGWSRYSIVDEIMAREG